MIIDIAATVAFIVFLVVGIRFRKVVDPLVYYIFPMGLIVYSVFFPSSELFNILGGLSKKLLIFLLFIKPVAKILHSKLLMKVTGYRRQLGLITFWLFFVHTAGLIYLYNLWSVNDYLTAKHLIGVIAGIGLIILAITSNDYSIKLLKNNWKKLQYLVYPVLFGVLYHTSINEYGNLNEFYIICGVFVALKLLEWKGVTIPGRKN
jgi:sulfoxide reductase heme-binding subunit YedZ